MTTQHEEPQDVLPPGVESRTTVIQVEAETLEGMRKEARTLGLGAFTIYSDEPTSISGGGTAPAPTQLFAASILF